MNDSTFQQSFSGAQFNPVLSDNDSNETEKHNNKRSCDNCRNRKVRCDAHLSIPCSSCRRFDAECIISKPKKSGVPSRKYMDSLEKRIEHLEALLLEQSISNAPTGSSSSSPIAATKQQEDTIESPLPDISKVSDPNTRSPSPPTHTQQKPNKFIFSPWMNVTENSCSEQHTSISADKSLTSSLPEPHSQSTIDMIQEIPKFTPEFAECLLGRYFNFLHPRIPMLDKRSFLIQYYYQHPQPLEKHLFYAVCAVGCQFLPRTEMTGDCLIEREIGRCLREKAMTVMNLAYKESTISTLQTLLLMALLAPNSRNGEGSSTNWLILGAAIRMSQDLELHREDRYQHQSRSEVELRRRLAYSIYMWDKFSAMATGKPFAIRDEDFNVQMPSIYEQQPDDNIAINDLLSDGCIIPMLLEQTEIDICEKRPVYRPQTQIIPMSRLVSRILTSLYIPKNIYEAGVVDVNMILNIDMSLYAWRKAGLEQPAKDYIFHNELFELLYNAGTMFLYRPLISDTTTSKTTLIDNKINQALDVCTTAAEKIINFLEVAPIWGIPCMKDCMVSLCASIFLQNCNNYEDLDTCLRARKNVHRCANLYKCDDLVWKCENALVLDKLAKQLPHDEANCLQSMITEQQQQQNNEEYTSPPPVNDNNYLNMMTENTIATKTFTDDDLNDDSYMDLVLSWQELQQKQQQSARNDLGSTAMDIVPDQSSFEDFTLLVQQQPF